MKKLFVLMVAVFGTLILSGCDYGSGTQTEAQIIVVDTTMDFSDKLVEYDMIRIKTAVDNYDLRCDQLESVVSYDSGLLIIEYQNGIVEIFQGSWQLRFYND